jgi:serine protease Do
MENDMNDTPIAKPRRMLSARRIALLATTIAGLGVAAYVVAPAFAPNQGLSTSAYAQNLTEQAKTLPKPVGFADIVAKVKPAVISVRVKVDSGLDTMSFSDSSPFPKGSPFERFFRRFGMPDDLTPHRPHRHNFVTGQGSGFFISPDGYAVTNYHVVEKATTVEVKTDDGKTHSAKVIGTDPRTDLALIKVDGSNYPYVKLADKEPRIGDWVLAVGNPFGLGGTVTAGIVSARGRDIGAGPYDDFIQIDAPVNKGNSGGPTFDVDGHVIGVNTAIFSPSGGSVGIAFAIPAATVKSVVTQLKDKGAVTRGWIGVQIQPVTQDIADSLGLKKAAGAIVAEPQPDSPAVKAGIKSGDVIATVDGKSVADARDLAKKIGAMPPGSTVKLGIIRKGQQKTVTVTLGRLPAQKEARVRSRDNNGNRTDVPRLGLTLAPADNVSGAGSSGVVITDIDPDGVAASHGMKTGDVILQVGDKTVSNPADVRNALIEARKDGKRTVLFRVKSGDSLRFVALPLGRA